MGFTDKIYDVYSNIRRSFFDSEDDNLVYDDPYASANMTSSAPDYSYYEEQPAVESVENEQPEQQMESSSVSDTIVSKIVMVRPKDIDSVREAADHLISNEAVVLCLKDIDKTESRRWLDYLGGVTYAIDGKINRIAPFVYFLTPRGVDLLSGFECNV